MATVFDVIIIGAGPAGLLAGRTCAKAGCTNVLLLDKKVPWEHTIPCAEGVGKLGFHESADPVKPAWIRHAVTSSTFHAPNGSFIQYVDKHGGYIIDRTRMQHDIADEIAANGITCRFGASVIEITAPAEQHRTVVTSTGESFTGRIIIDASGPITRFGKTEPIFSQHADLEPAYFVVAEGCDIPTDQVHIYAGQQIAPGGYAWVFPRGKGAANIGIVIGRSLPHTVNIRTLLDQFVARNFPAVSIVKRFAGPIPCGFRRPLPMAIPGFIKAGDAASTVNPISRAGISEAMLCGVLAGTTALQMLAASSRKELITAARQYERVWNEKRGARHLKLAKVKQSLRSIPDDDYNRGAETLSAIPPAEMTMSKIFRASLSRFPRLVWALRHLM